MFRLFTEDQYAVLFKLTGGVFDIFDVFASGAGTNRGSKEVNASQVITVNYQCHPALHTLSLIVDRDLEQTQRITNIYVSLFM